MTARKRPSARERLIESHRIYAWDERCGPQRMTAFSRRLRIALREAVTLAVSEGYNAGWSSKLCMGGRGTLNEKAAVVAAVLASGKRPPKGGKR